MSSARMRLASVTVTSLPCMSVTVTGSAGVGDTATGSTALSSTVAVRGPARARGSSAMRTSARRVPPSSAWVPGAAVLVAEQAASASASGGVVPGSCGAGRGGGRERGRGRREQHREGGRATQGDVLVWWWGRVPGAAGHPPCRASPLSGATSCGSAHPQGDLLRGLLRDGLRPLVGGLDPVGALREPREADLGESAALDAHGQGADLLLALGHHDADLTLRLDAPRGDLDAHGRALACPDLLLRELGRDLRGRLRDLRTHLRRG